MSKIILEKNRNKKNPSFKKSDMFGFYCFGDFKGQDYFEICTTSSEENNVNAKHYRQVIDIDKKTAIELIKLLKDNFKI